MASLLNGKLEAYFGIKLPANRIHELIAGPHQTSVTVTKCVVLDGEWGKKGCIIHWEYIHDGDLKVAGELVEDIDDLNFSTTFKVIGGDITKEYTEFKVIVQAIPQTADTSQIHCTVVYEKLREDVSELFSQFLIAVQLAKSTADT